MKAESIDLFYDQETLLQKMQEANFKYCSYKNLTDGISAIHSGFKL
jgi:ubiquinone/menaquinone biosynthesis C-methylase UbiE